MLKRALFLDRDGVLNKAIVEHGKPYAPTFLDQFVLLPGVVKALDVSKKLGFVNIVVTNQPDIATGKVTKEFVEACHEKLLEVAKVDAIYVCPHEAADKCACRKPLPGMLLQAAEAWDVDLNHSFLVGDRWRDVEAGQAVGCSCFFINNHYNERRPEGHFEEVRSLEEVIRKLVTKN